LRPSATSGPHWSWPKAPLAGRAYLLSELAGKHWPARAATWTRSRSGRTPSALYRRPGATRMPQAGCTPGRPDGVLGMRRHPRGLAICREGMALAGGAPDSSGLAGLIHETARACYFSGLAGEAEPLCRQSLEMAERLGVVRVQAEALTTLGLLARPVDGGGAVGLQPAVRSWPRRPGCCRGQSGPPQHGHCAWSRNRASLRRRRYHFGRAAELSRQTGAVAEELFSRNQAVGIGLVEGDSSICTAGDSCSARLLEMAPDPGPAR